MSTIPSALAPFRHARSAVPAPLAATARRVSVALAISAATPAILAAQALQVPPHSPPAFDAEGLAAITAAFEALIEEERIPGAVLVLAQGDEIVLSEALGHFADDGAVPLETDSLFRVASMTKPFVSVAALALVERGVIGLDEPITGYLPELDGLVVAGSGDDPSVGTVAPERPITVADLLRHTSGFTYSFFGAAPESLRALYAERGVDQLTADVPAGEALRRLATIPLAYQPGTRFEYGFSTDVLGVLLERATGESLDAIVAELVTDPLELASTGFFVGEEDRARVVPLDADDPQAGWLEEWIRVRAEPGEGYISGGAGLVTTAEDYTRFLQAILNGGELDGVRILAPETVDLILTDHIAGLEGGPADTAYGFGYGFAVRVSEEGEYSPGTLGDAFWSGITGTGFTIDRRNDVVGVILTAGPSARAETRVLFKTLALEALAD